MSDPSKVFALSKIFHERARLGIMTVLVAEVDGVDFNDLLKRLKLTKGNLAVHAAKLEEAGYVEINKRFEGKFPRTTYKASTKGRRDFSAYLSILEDIVSHAKEHA